MRTGSSTLNRSRLDSAETSLAVNLLDPLASRHHPVVRSLGHRDGERSTLFVVLSLQEQLCCGKSGKSVKSTEVAGKR